MKKWTPRFGLAAVAVLVGVYGCVSPLQPESESELRERLLSANRAYLQAVSAGPVIELSRTTSDVETELTNKRRAELDRMSGPSAYTDQPLDLGPDLMGVEAIQTVGMTLQRAIHLAAQNNLSVQVARLQPAISQTQITQAEASFDAIFFSDFNFEKNDTPQPSAALAQFGSVKDEERSLNTGIRKTLTSGGEMTLSTRFARNSREPSFFNVNTWHDANILASLNQPLLRNFGADVNRAQIMLSNNARRQSLHDLRRELLDTMLNTESAYWTLVFTRQQLLIQNKLLERTITDRDQLKQRENFDVSPVRLTEANSFVELRRGDVIRSRQAVRAASDRIKNLIYAKDMPLTGETLILPVDNPVDLPLKFSMLDAVTTALRHRPQLQQLLSLINDATIRQRVADNQRLPQLDLAATVRYNGVTRNAGEGIDDAYDTVTDGEYIDYVLTAQFEVPIGNRGPEALYRQQQLSRSAAVINYQRNAEQVILEIKDALRNLHTTYQLIGSARAARRSASDNLRAIEEQEKAGQALTPEFLLDLKLSTQSRLANAEIQEIQALTDYNTAIASFYRVMGTLLERNGIEFSDEAIEP